MAEWISHHAEVLDALARIETDSVDGILSDFPYGLGNKQPTIEEIRRYLDGEQFDTGGDFMGADWHVPSVPTWREMLRVLKPGGYLLGFGAPRTIDLISLGARAVGFAIRDVIAFAWMFGSGFPKSQDVSKAIDDAAGATRDVVGPDPNHRRTVHSAAIYDGVQQRPTHLTSSATALAAEWSGHGTALKPAFEPILLARKPLIGTLAENIALHGAGALAIDASRIATDWSERSEAWKRSGHSGKPDAEKIAAPPGNGIECHPGGRWPANVALDEGSAALLDVETGTLRTHGGSVEAHHAALGYMGGGRGSTRGVVADEGGPSRFFYVAKASREERELGCASLPRRSAGEATLREDGSAGLNSPRAGAGRTSGARNYHPNVKPVQLTRWLAGLILPPASAGRVRRILVPYAGSGSEMIGAILAGWDLVEGIEREPRPGIPDSPDYQAILRARVHLALTNPRAFEPHAERKTEKTNPGQASLFGESA